MVSDLYRHRRAFWAGFSAQAPALFARMAYATEHSRWLSVGPLPLVVAHYVANTGAGIFVRGKRGVRTGLIRELLFPRRALLAQALGRPDLKLGSLFLLSAGIRADMTDETNWPTARTWFEENSPLYERALLAVQERQPAPPGADAALDEAP